MWQASANCFMLLEHDMRLAASSTFCTAGSSRPIRMAIMAITTSNSIRVNPLLPCPPEFASRILIDRSFGALNTHKTIHAPSHFPGHEDTKHAVPPTEQFACKVAVPQLKMIKL